jgi:tripartite-type tricarboxylate transporter receptor subunit TctC
VQKLNQALVKALKSPEVLAAFDKQGLESQPGTPEELAKYMAREYETWGKVVKQANIKAQ